MLPRPFNCPYAVDFFQPLLDTAIGQASHSILLLSYWPRAMLLVNSRDPCSNLCPGGPLGFLPSSLRKFIASLSPTLVSLAQCGAERWGPPSLAMVITFDLPTPLNNSFLALCASITHGTPLTQPLGLHF